MLYREQAGDARAAADVLARALEVDARESRGARGARRRARRDRPARSAPSTPWAARSPSTPTTPGSTARARRCTRRSGEGRRRSWIWSRRTRRAAAATPGRSSAALGRAAAACAAKDTPEARATRSGLRLRLAEVLTRAGEIERARAELIDLTRRRERGSRRACARSPRSRRPRAIGTRRSPYTDGCSPSRTARRSSIRRSASRARARAATGWPTRARALERAKPRRARQRGRARRSSARSTSVTGAGRELAALILEDAARAPDVADPLRATWSRRGASCSTRRAEPRAPPRCSRRPRACGPTTWRPRCSSPTPTRSPAGSPRLAPSSTRGRGLAKGRRTKALAAVHRRLARLDQAAGDSAAALSALSRAFDNDPQNAQLAMELGDARRRARRPEPATRAFRAVTMMKPAPAGSPDGATRTDPRPRLLSPRPHGLPPGGSAKGAAHDRQGRRRRSHARGGSRAPRSAPGRLSGGADSSVSGRPQRCARFAPDAARGRALPTSPEDSLESAGFFKNPAWLRTAVFASRFARHRARAGERCEASRTGKKARFAP